MVKIKTKKRALISVFDKTGIKDFARELARLGWEIIATGGTAKILRKAGIKIIPIEKVTGNPEAFDGRVKTISFQVESAILYERANPRHKLEAERLGIQPIDMVVSNFYPFERIARRKKLNLKEAFENIDIGGPTMVRSAAKNYRSVIVLIDPKDYPKVIRVLKKEGEIPEEYRFILAQKAFEKTAKYDTTISNYLKYAISRKFKNPSKKSFKPPLW